MSSILSMVRSLWMPARALTLIFEYEEKIGAVKARPERINCLVADMRASSSTEVWNGDAEADAAMLAYARGLVPTWNRCVRRRLLRSKGIILHLFCGESRKACEELASKHGMVHLAVDSENLVGLGTFRFLLQLAVQGKISAVVGGSPCRPSACAATSLSLRVGNAPRPLRIRGEPLFSTNVSPGCPTPGWSALKLAAWRTSLTPHLQLSSARTFHSGVEGAEG